MMKLLKRLLPAIALGAAAFFAFFWLFEAGALVSLLFGVGGFFGGYLLLAPRTIDPEFAELERVYGITPSMIKKTVAEGSTKVKKMRALLGKVDDADVRGTIGAIIEHTEHIFLDLKKDPKDIKAARQFLAYYLDATINIIEKYIALSHMRSSGDREKTIGKVRDLLQSVEAAFRKQLDQLYNDDFLDLDAEITVLENVIRQDGLADPKRTSAGGTK